MQTLQITSERRITEEFKEELPSKQTDLSKNNHYGGYYNLRELDTIINQNFERFAYDKDFRRIAAEKPEIIDAMKRIKRMYHDKIASYNFPIHTFENMHMRELRAILDARLETEEFYKRLQELESNLTTRRKTRISDNLRYASLLQEKKRMKEEKLQVYRLLGEEARKKKQEAGQSSRQVKQSGIEQLKRNLYQNSIDCIRATPGFSYCIKNPESCEFIPKLKLLIGKEGIDKKLSEIFSNNQNIVYKGFIRKIKETMQTKDMVLENILKGEAIKSGKQASKFKIIDLNPATWNWLASYYHSNNQVRNFVLKYREDYAKSLRDLVDETYVKMLRSPQNWN